VAVSIAVGRRKEDQLKEMKVGEYNLTLEGTITQPGTRLMLSQRERSCIFPSLSLFNFGGGTFHSLTFDPWRGMT
jgi:hypothetical protein